MTASPPPEGTLSFRLTVPDGFRTTTGEVCRFPPVSASGVIAEVRLLADHRLELELDGPRGRHWLLHAVPPIPLPPRLDVVITWDATGVELHLNGRKVATAPA